MKKLILIAVATSLVSLHSFGQGQVVFANTSTTKIFTNSAASTTVTAGQGAAISGAGAYTFALLAYNVGNNAGTTVTATDNSLTPWSDSSWTLIGYAQNTGSSGRIFEINDGGNNYLTAPTSAAFGVGLYSTMVVVGWNTAVGGSTLATFAQALSSQATGLFSGISGEGSILWGNGTQPPNTTVFGAAAGNISAFTMGLPTPEPGTIALAGLGMASLLALRRKK